ncbi:MAG: hypothetical protein ABH803_02105 [Candidatus Micrarchaeota archaeon]
MTYSVSDAVIEIMRQMQPLKYAFDKDLVNYSALARSIQPMVSQKLGEEVSLDAIIMAVRRNSSSFWLEQSKEDVFSVLKNSKLDLRTGLVSLYVNRTLENYERLLALEKRFSLGESGKMYLIQRSSDLSIIALSSIAPEIIEAVGKENILTQNDDLALLTLTIDVGKSASNISGILELLAHHFSLLGVSLVLFFSTMGKAYFLFEDTHSPKVYEQFNKLLAQTKVIASSKS